MALFENMASLLVLKANNNRLTALPLSARKFEARKFEQLDLFNNSFGKATIFDFHDAAAVEFAFPTLQEVMDCSPAHLRLELMPV